MWFGVPSGIGVIADWSFNHVSALVKRTARSASVSRHTVAPSMHSMRHSMRRSLFGSAR